MYLKIKTAHNKVLPKAWHPFFNQLFYFIHHFYFNLSLVLIIHAFGNTRNVGQNSRSAPILTNAGRIASAVGLRRRCATTSSNSTFAKLLRLQTSFPLRNFANPPRVMPYYKMTRQLIVYLTIFITACGQNSQSADNILTDSKEVTIDSVQTFSITNATADDFKTAKSKSRDKILYDTTTFKKVNGEIKLPVDRKWKPFVTFTDTLLNTDETDIREYQYLGQFDKIGFYIIGGSFWEHYECYLIDKRTGRQTTIWNTPLISPTDKFIANLSMTYGLDGVPNGLQIWRINRQENNQVEPISLVKHLELDQQIWAPDDFVWETDNSLILKVVAVDKFMNENGQPNENDFYYLRLRIK
ncbi:MAG: hypothetical protein H6554_10250 [Chitinophagales bacterium]|nr:hypothetical protein [Chitinophagales bacterium]